MKKRRYRILSFFILICFLLSGCQKQGLGTSFFARPDTYDAENAFDELTNDWFVRQMSEDPFSCHFSISEPASFGISTSKECFENISYEEFKDAQKEALSFFHALKDISYRELPERKQLVYDILCDYYERQREFDDFYYYADPLSPTSGVPSSLPTLLAAFSFANEEDIRLYFSFLDDVDIYFEQLVSFAKEKNERELLADNGCLDETILFCKNFSAYSPKHFLISSFNERITNCDFLDESEKKKYQKENADYIHNVVLPSYLSLYKELSSIKIKSDSIISLCQLPYGHRYYALLTEAATGCDDSPFRLFQKIQEKREADLKEMSRLFSTHPTLASTLSNYTCPVSEPEEMLEILKRSIAEDFPDCGEVAVDVNTISPQLEKHSAPAYYLIAPLDNLNRHHIYYNPNSFPSSLELFTTMAHEGFPGHLYQTCMSYSADFAPVRLLLSYPAYVEGWATYVELESFAYAGIPTEAAKVFALNQSVVLSLYATADIGIHYYGWSEHKLCEFLRTYGISDKDVASRIYALILSDPANYLKYYVGYLNFLDLKEKCREAYPDTFTPLAFHKVILQTGPAPFSILEDRLFSYFSSRD